MEPKPSADILTRSASFAPATVDPEKRTVDLIWTTGARVLRNTWDGQFYEELSLDPKHVRMGRLSSGAAPLLANHDARSLDSVIGVVESARLEKAQGVARVRFAAGDPEADKAWNKVKQGVLRSVSVGYRVHKLEKVEGGEDKTPVYRAIDWEPMEASLVPMGADAGARVRSQGEHMDPKAQEQNTNDGTPDEIRAEAVRLERVRVDEIQRIGRILKGGILDDEGFVRKLVNDGTPVEQARSIILEELARRSDETTERRSAIEYVGGGDNPDRRVRSMAEALAARFGGPKPSDPAHQFMRMSASDMARHLLEARGVSTRLLSKSQVIARAYTTSSDFPALLQETGNRFLRSGYDSYPGGVRVIARESSVPDFRMKTVAQLGEAPTLLKVNEAGEFTHGAMAESKEAYRVQSYGRIFGLTRQAIVNDDLGAFATVITKFGRGAAEFIAQQLASLLTSNPVMNDGIAVFHADHGNLESSPGPITIAQLGSGFKSMRLQTGLDGETPIDVTPKYLVVPAALESVALQMTAQINANQASNVNPYAARLEVVVDPRLDASSSTAWYLAADPNAFDGIEYSFLDGDGGPVIETKNGWEVDGTEFKVRLDFGCAVLEHRGLYKNAGA